MSVQPTYSSRRILLPVKPWFVTLTLVAALFLNLIPYGRLPGVPDWVALVLAFWCVREPLRVGMGTAFVLGLVLDVAYASAWASTPWPTCCSPSPPPRCRGACCGSP
jgi:rod shape-determining protein MreD